MPKRVRSRSAEYSALWAEPPQRRPSVTREQVVREALALLDEVGFDGLTMRRLAERLGVQAASLYNHVRDKHELLALLADAICGEVAEITLGARVSRQEWRHKLEEGARDFRRVLLAHRDAARVLVATPPVGPQRIRSIEQWLALLRAGGLSDRDVADVASVVNTFVTGFVLDETLALPRDDMPDVSAEDMRAQVKGWFQSLPSERYPMIVALTDDLVDADNDRRFELALQLLLDGLERRVAQTPNNRRVSLRVHARQRDQPRE